MLIRSGENTADRAYPWRPNPHSNLRTMLKPCSHGNNLRLVVFQPRKKSRLGATLQLHFHSNSLRSVCGTELCDMSPDRCTFSMERAPKKYEDAEWKFHGRALMGSAPCSAHELILCRFVNVQNTIASHRMTERCCLYSGHHRRRSTRSRTLFLSKIVISAIRFSLVLEFFSRFE